MQAFLWKVYIGGVNWMKLFQHVGLWWLPAKAEKKVAGEAMFMGNDPTKLLLHGAFDYDFQPGI